MPDAPLDPQQAMERLGHLAEEGERAVLEARTPEQLEELRVRYLGRKAELTQILRSIPSQPEEWRAQLGKRGNEARRALEALLEERSAALDRGAARGSPARARRSTSRCRASRSTPGTCTC